MVLGYFSRRRTPLQNPSKVPSAGGRRGSTFGALLEHFLTKSGVLAGSAQVLPGPGFGLEIWGNPGSAGLSEGRPNPGPEGAGRSPNLGPEALGGALGGAPARTWRTAGFPLGWAPKWPPNRRPGAGLPRAGNLAKSWENRKKVLKSHFWGGFPRSREIWKKWPSARKNGTLRDIFGPDRAQKPRPNPPRKPGFPKSPRKL